MSLSTDKFFYQSLNTSADVIEVTDGRIYNTAREEIDEEEDKIPYLIISHEGTRNNIESKDDVGESTSDTDTISVLVVAETRSALADIAELVRNTIRDDFSDFGDDEATELGFSFEDYNFSASPISFDASKPCYFQTLNYICETTNID